MKKVCLLLFIMLSLSACRPISNPDWVSDDADNFSLEQLYIVNPDDYSSLEYKQIIIEFEITHIRISAETTHVCFEYQKEQIVSINNNDYTYLFTLKAHTSIPYYKNPFKVGDIIKINGIILNTSFDINLFMEEHNKRYLTLIEISPSIVVTSTD